MTRSSPQKDPDDQADESPQALRSRDAAEWTTLIASFVVVALLIGAAFYEHYGRDEVSGTVIAISVASDDAVQRDDLYYVPFTVKNRGSAPAEDVTIMFEVLDGEEIVEESSVVIPFLPNSGSAEGELVTAFDPGTHQIDARPATLLSP